MESSAEGEPLTFRMWHQELRNILIDRGLQGYKQKALTDYFKKRVDGEEVKGYLELLLKEDKVQKFWYRTDFYWRATTEILKEPE
jgi:hypothetical protein